MRRPRRTAATAGRLAAHATHGRPQVGATRTCWDDNVDHRAGSSFHSNPAVGQSQSALGSRADDRIQARRVTGGGNGMSEQQRRVRVGLRADGRPRTARGSWRRWNCCGRSDPTCASPSPEAIASRMRRTGWSSAVWCPGRSCRSSTAPRAAWRSPASTRASAFRRSRRWHETARSPFRQCGPYPTYAATPGSRSPAWT